MSNLGFSHRVNPLPESFADQIRDWQSRNKAAGYPEVTGNGGDLSDLFAINKNVNKKIKFTRTSGLLTEKDALVAIEGDCDVYGHRKGAEAWQKGFGQDEVTLMNMWVNTGGPKWTPGATTPAPRWERHNVVVYWDDPEDPLVFSNPFKLPFDHGDFRKPVRLSKIVKKVKLLYAYNRENLWDMWGDWSQPVEAEE